ncbi:alpha/beta hydrolase [Lysobacter caseinilyticus]|uniref:Alpha/beta hydrolase n=1 Tax=Noviluteimonas caseinilytica TaxID=2675101 RepID=A0ABN6FZD7_9GAMM|nr:alpha/beta hydrolase [Lysobacter caseinilyticus]BCT93167.1 alpha/beta hydrolase [Lysobacter caseinilyticus]
MALAMLFAVAPASARFLPNVPSEFEASLVIGGIRQHVLVRGPANAPLLVIVHGGPGVNENPLYRQYVPQLESAYQVVYWEQRGTGRSLPPGMPRQTLDIPQFVSDLGELVSLLTRKYKQDKVVLLAHSWGTIPAALYVREHPERIAAYVAIGPMVDVPASEREGWQWARDSAVAAGDAKALKALDRIGPPPHDVDAMLVSRKWVERFGGAFHQPMRTRTLLFTAMKDNKIGIPDLVLFGRGNHVSLDALWPGIRDFRLPVQGPWDMPVAFLLGDHDHVTSTAVARTYFDAMDAPCKRWVAFPGSAHNPPYEEPESFARFMLEQLPGWTRDCTASQAGAPQETR